MLGTIETFSEMEIQNGQRASGKKSIAELRTRFGKWQNGVLEGKL
jgi:hypothetical protein